MIAESKESKSKRQARRMERIASIRRHRTVSIIILGLIILASLAYFVTVVIEKLGPFKEFTCKYVPSRVIHVGVIVDSEFDEYYGRNKVKSEIEDILRAVSQPFLRQVGIEFRVKQVLYPDNSEFSGDKRTLTKCSEKDDVDGLGSTLHAWVKDRSGNFEKVMTWILFKKCWPAPKDGADSDSTVSGKGSLPGYDTTQYIVVNAGTKFVAKTITHELGHNLGQHHTWCKESYKDLPRNSETGGEGENCCSSGCEPKTDDGYHHGIMDYYNAGGVWAVKDGGSGRPAFHSVHEASMCQALKEDYIVWHKNAQGIEPDVMYWGEIEGVTHLMGVFFVAVLCILLIISIFELLETYSTKAKKLQEKQKKTEKVNDLKNSPDPSINEMELSAGKVKKSMRSYREAHPMESVRNTGTPSCEANIGIPIATATQSRRNEDAIEPLTKSAMAALTKSIASPNMAMSAEAPKMSKAIDMSICGEGECSPLKRTVRRYKAEKLGVDESSALSSSMMPSKNTSTVLKSTSAPIRLHVKTIPPSAPKMKQQLPSFNEGKGSGISSHQSPIPRPRPPLAPAPTRVKQQMSFSAGKGGYPGVRTDCKDSSKGKGKGRKTGKGKGKGKMK